MLYAKIVNGEVDIFPYDVGDLRRENPNVSFPYTALDNTDIREEYGIVEVEKGKRPIKRGYQPDKTPPRLVDGKWQEHWNMFELNYEEARRRSYFYWGDQMDAVVKGMIAIKESGIDIGEPMDDLIYELESIKTTFPKPDNLSDEYFTGPVDPTIHDDKNMEYGTAIPLDDERNPYKPKKGSIEYQREDGEYYDKDGNRISAPLTRLARKTGQ